MMVLMNMDGAMHSAPLAQKPLGAFTLESSSTTGILTELVMMRVGTAMHSAPLAQQPLVAITWGSSSEE